MTAAKTYPIAVPAAPPSPPEGYRFTGYMVLDQRGGHTDLMDGEVLWGRFAQPERRLDLELASEVWALNGVKTYDLWATAECQCTDADGETGAYEAHCQFDTNRLINAGWQPWVNASNLREPAVTLEQMRANGDKPLGHEAIVEGGI
jgi:hypothetical protein